MNIAEAKRKIATIERLVEEIKTSEQLNNR